MGDGCRTASIAAADGVSGLAAFEAAKRPFDLLLTDVMVPGPMNGRHLADEVARRWPRTRLVFMSGYSENILTTQGRLEASVLLLNKPFHKPELAMILRQALDTEPSPIAPPEFPTPTSSRRRSRERRPPARPKKGRKRAS